MPTEVTAIDGDSLCVIAMQNGFLNCQPLRDEPKNAAFLNRPLQNGDVITVPDIRLQTDSKPTDAAHPFVKKNAPPVSIRYVHGSPDKHYLEDTETTVLNVSNFQTDKGGSAAKDPFPDKFEFHQEGHADPDTFKVEVVDPGAGGGPIQVILDPRMPVYSLVNGKLVVTDHTVFQNATAQFPSLTVDCALVHSAVSFRSKYLRLVTHGSDLRSKPDQTVFVVSPADGKGTGQAQDLDNVEILDFEIRATYVILRCPAPTKCSVSVSKPVGEESEQLRFRLAFHIFTRRGTGAPMDGLTAEKVRHAALRDVRAMYAQAAMAPKLVSADGSNGGPAVIFLPEPDDNMIVIGDISGRGASGRNKSGQTSTLTIFDSFPPTTIGTVTLSNTMKKPIEVGNAIRDALDSSIFKVDVFLNPFHDGAALNGSCDVLVTRLDGSQLTLGVLTDDTVLRNNITVARVNIDVVDRNSNPQTRRIVRASPGPDGVMNVYSIGTVLDGSLAFSSPLNGAFPANMHELPPILNSILCDTQFLDATTPLPDVLAHECGHILGDVNHVPKFDAHFHTELMTGSGEDSKPVGGPKRISDSPILVHYEQLDPAGSVKLINAVKRLRTTRTELVEKW